METNSSLFALRRAHLCVGVGEHPHHVLANHLVGGKEGAAWSVHKAGVRVPSQDRDTWSFIEI